MAIQEGFIIDVLATVDAELTERDFDITPQAQILVIDNWISIYEDMPLNRFEQKCINQLQAAREHLYRKNRNTFPKTA